MLCSHIFSWIIIWETYSQLIFLNLVLLFLEKSSSNFEINTFMSDILHCIKDESLAGKSSRSQEFFEKGFFWSQEMSEGRGKSSLEARKFSRRKGQEFVWQGGGSSE